MDEASSIPNFGSNGSVLNSDTMTDALRQKYEEGENGFGFRDMRTQKVWPRYAIFMMCFGSALAGYAFAKVPSNGTAW